VKRSWRKCSAIALGVLGLGLFATSWSGSRPSGVHSSGGWLGEGAGDRSTEAPSARRDPTASSWRSSSIAANRSANAPDPGYPSAGSRPTELPQWLRDAVDLDDDPDVLVSINRDGMGTEGLNPRHLAVLRDIIELNRLDESRSSSDYDDGNGTFEPPELGFQLWVDGQLVALSLGADPYSTFGYGIESLPASIAELDRLQLLDVQSSRLTELPFEIGYLDELRELRAQRNRLQQLPDSITRLSRLRGVHLSRNEISELPESIGELSALEWMYLSDNPLESLPHGIENLQNLRALGLQYSTSDPGRPTVAGAGERFQGLDRLPAALDSMSALDTVYVRGNQFGCVDDRFTMQLATTSSTRLFGLSAQRCSP